MEHDLPKLKQRLEALNEHVTELNSIGFAKKLQAIILRPGFTSVAEFALLMSAVESLNHGIEGHIQLSKQLLDAAERVKSTGAISTAA